MRARRRIGRLLVALGAVAGWTAWAGVLVPTLDAFASFMPLFAGVAAFGTLLAWPRSLGAMALPLIALVPPVATIAPEFLRTIPAARADAPPIRIVTHNVWVDNADPATTAQVLLDARPDIVLLQEVNGAFHPALEALRGRLPYITPCPKSCGLAIASRWPIVESDYFLKDARRRAFGPPMLWARIAGPGGPISVATIHYPWPLPARAQAAKRAALARALARTPREGLIVAGDMNLTPWAAAMREQDRALSPMTRLTRALFSWSRMLPALPIDQLYAGPDWGLVEARRLPATGSDHHPLLVVLGRR